MRGGDMPHTNSGDDPVTDVSDLETIEDEIRSEEKPHKVGRHSVRAALLGLSLTMSALLPGGKPAEAKTAPREASVSTSESLNDSDAESESSEGTPSMITYVTKDGEFESLRDLSHDVSESELEDITSASVVIRGNFDASALNHLHSTKKLDITANKPGVSLEGIDGSQLSELEDVYIMLMSDNEISQDKMGFLADLPKLKTLAIESNRCHYDAELLGQLEGVDLTLRMNEVADLDFSKLTKLKSLTLTGGASDIAAGLSSKDIQTLRDAGVELKYGNDEADAERIDQINARLDEIVDSFELSEDASDIDKLDAILTFVLNSYSYDPEIKAALKDGTVKSKDHTKFYKDGYLFGALESDTQICGNYASMTRALAYRVGLESRLVANSDHIWNAVKIDGYYWYCDPTSLDGESRSVVDDSATVTEYNPDTGETTITVSYTQGKKAEETFAEGNNDEKYDYTFYLLDPNDPRHSDELSPIKGIDFSFSEIPDELEPAHGGHPGREAEYANASQPAEESSASFDASVDDMPVGLDAEPGNVEEDAYDNAEDISGKNYEVSFNGKKFIVPGAILIGILGALGGGILIKKNNDKKRRRRSSYGSWDSSNRYSSSSRSRSSSRSGYSRRSSSSRSSSSWEDFTR